MPPAPMIAAVSSALAPATGGGTPDIPGEDASLPEFAQMVDGEQGLGLAARPKGMALMRSLPLQSNQPSRPQSTLAPTVPIASPASGEAPPPAPPIPVAITQAAHADVTERGGGDLESDAQGLLAEEPAASAQAVEAAPPQLVMPTQTLPPATGRETKRTDGDIGNADTASEAEGHTVKLKSSGLPPAAGAHSASAPLAGPVVQAQPPASVEHTGKNTPQQEGAIPMPPLATGQPDPTLLSAPQQEAARIISAAPGRFGEELGIAIARHALRDANGANETLTLRIDPPEHGRIEVTLNFEEGGPLRAVVVASHSGTLELLRRDSADLTRALAQAGIGTDTQSFSFSSQSGGGERGRDAQAQAFHQRAVLDDTSHVQDDAIPLTSDYRRLRSSGILNLIA